MNTVFFGVQRENRIRALVSMFPYISTSALQRTFFRFPSGKRKCRIVLRRMVEKKQLRRFMAGEYVYHIDAKTSQWQHTHDVTQFYFDLLFSLKKPQEIVYYKKEYEYGTGRADGLYILKLHESGSGVKFFLEMDDMTHDFEKVGLYEEYFKSMTWRREFWADPLKSGRASFPLVLVVTEREIPGSDIIRVVTAKPGEKYLEVLTGGR